MRTLLMGLLLAVPTPTPATTYQADCAGLTITSSGYPDGAWGMFSIGDEPPRELVLNDTGFTAWPGDLDGLNEFWIMPDLTDPATSTRGSVQCEPTLFAEPEVDVQVGEIAPEPVPAGLDLSAWVDVALAPPW